VGFADGGVAEILDTVWVGACLLEVACLCPADPYLASLETVLLDNSNGEQGGVLSRRGDVRRKRMTKNTRQHARNTHTHTPPPAPHTHPNEEDESKGKEPLLFRRRLEESLHSRDLDTKRAI